MNNIYRAKKVCEMFGWSRSHFYDQIQKGKFAPADVQLSARAVGWTEETVLRERDKRVAAMAKPSGLRHQLPALAQERLRELLHYDPESAITSQRM